MEKGHGVRRHGAVGDADPGGAVKYLLILIGLIGGITYVFVAGPKVVHGRDMTGEDRRQAVWDRLAQLETGRRDMLIRAQGRLASMTPPDRARRGGPWGEGYREGFARGYALGMTAASSSQSNPKFIQFSP